MVGVEVEVALGTMTAGIVTSCGLGLGRHSTNIDATATKHKIGTRILEAACETQQNRL